MRPASRKGRRSIALGSFRALEATMQTTQAQVLELVAPEHLGLESRSSFRQSAVGLLDQLPERTGRLVIDLRGTRSVDSAGLGALMLIQRRASERRQVVVLRRPNDELRFLLVLTKLDDLFEVEADVA
jgi:anti-anti-sigma factor